MPTWTSWRTSLRVRSQEFGWRPKPAKSGGHFGILRPLREEHTWDQIAEPLPSDGQLFHNLVREGLPTIHSETYRDASDGPTLASSTICQILSGRGECDHRRAIRGRTRPGKVVVIPFRIAPDGVRACGA